MGFSWFLKLALTCIDHLAWPLLALGYPLCASIRAIENDSYSKTRDLISYWILLSLIYLFECAFLRLLSWFQFWPYIKLMIIFWLIIPDFGRAYYVYNNLIRSCITVNPQVVISRLKNWRKLFVKKENFLLHAERYIQENGTEALEKLISSKITTPSIGAEATNTIRATDKKEKQQIIMHNIGAEARNTTTATDKKETQQIPTHNIGADATYTIRATDKKQTQQITMQNIGVEATSTIRATDKKEKETQQTNGKKIQMEDKDIKDVEVIEKKEISAGKRDIPIMPNPSPNLSIPSAMKEAKGMAKKDAAGGEHPQSSTHKEVQKEWTCALCQVTTTCEKNLIMHLNGRLHKVTCEALNAKNQPTPQKIKNDQSKESKQKNFINQPANVEQKNIKCKENNSTRDQKGVVMNNSKLRCEACNITCSSDVNLASHLKGKRHLDQIFMMNKSKVRCEECNVTCTSLGDLASHMKGKRHLAQIQI